jgi:predicted RNase H-like HicB family nuclease
MKTYAYPIHITEIEPGEFEARCRDLPAVLTFAATRDDAWLNAIDAIGVIVDHLLDRGQPVPPPSPTARGEQLAPLPLRVAMRAALVDAVGRNQLSKVALADLMGQDEKAARRVLSGKGATVEMTARALRALGEPPILAAAI